MELGANGYDITVERGALQRANELLRLNRKVLIVTDDGVPKEYAEKIASFCDEPHTVTLPMGEQNKCMQTYTELLEVMVKNEFDRNDCVVAVGGGVMGDLAGFVASTYMRGVDFYNVPTTLLSQIDSSIGGKVAVDFSGYKNIVGAFYQPKAVLIDPDVLKTLSKRQFSCGMAEAVKMFATFNAEMFEEVENGFDGITDKIIVEALKIKKAVVEEDEKEKGLRKVLNFGHTVGHAVESIEEYTDNPLFHGECVGIGMLCMSSPDVAKRLETILKKLNMPTSWCGSKEKLKETMLHDKKAKGDKITVITVEKIGAFKEEKMTVEDITKRCEEVLSLL
jgi:3-dehydroquinate synthase